MIIPSLIQIQVDNMSIAEARAVKAILDDVLSDGCPDIQAHERTSTISDPVTVYKQVPDGRGFIHGLYHANILLDETYVTQHCRGDYQEAYRQNLETRTKSLLELLIETHGISSAISVKLAASPAVSRCEFFASRNCCHSS